MNHTAHVLDSKRSAYRKLHRLVQESQRAYLAAKLAELRGDHEEASVCSMHYHEVTALVDRGIMEALGITKTELEGRTL